MSTAAVRTWEQAWQHALYGRDGFYRTGGGPAAHFATSVQGIPHAGAVLARALVQLAHRHDLHTLVDLGAGRGELAEAVHALDPDLGVVAVDVQPRPPLLPAALTWVTSPGGPALPAGWSGLRDVLVVAHEWLDVVPAPVVTRVGQGWVELGVDPVTGRELPCGPVRPEDLAWLDTWTGPQVRRAEVGRARDLALADLLDRVEDGVVLVVDYGHTAADRPPDGTLTGYRQGRQVDPVPDGTTDVTAHVAMDSLLQVTGPGGRLQRQGEALEELLGADVPVPHALAASDPAAYLRELGRRSARGVLGAPGGLGDFWWLTAVRGRGAPDRPPRATVGR